MKSWKTEKNIFHYLECDLTIKKENTQCDGSCLQMFENGDFWIIIDQ